jgi:uncharacterized membrane protein YhaH (DUF805 family)
MNLLQTIWQRHRCLLGLVVAVAVMALVLAPLGGCATAPAPLPHIPVPPDTTTAPQRTAAPPTPGDLHTRTAWVFPVLCIGAAVALTAKRQHDFRTTP